MSNLNPPKCALELSLGPGKTLKIDHKLVLSCSNLEQVFTDPLLITSYGLFSPWTKPQAARSARKPGFFFMFWAHKKKTVNFYHYILQCWRNSGVLFLFSCKNHSATQQHKTCNNFLIQARRVKTQITVKSEIGSCHRQLGRHCFLSKETHFALKLPNESNNWHERQRADKCLRAGPQLTAQSTPRAGAGFHIEVAAAQTRAATAVDDAVASGRQRHTNTRAINNHTRLRHSAQRRQTTQTFVHTIYKSQMRWCWTDTQSRISIYKGVDCCPITRRFYANNLLLFF